MANPQLIHIRNDVVRDPKLKPKDFCVLLYLKWRSYDGKRERQTFAVDNADLKYHVNISDNATVNKSYKNLFDNGYILEPIVLIQNRPVHFELNKAKFDAKRNFTRLPVQLIYMLGRKEITHEGVRLIYYYESRITRPNNDFCFSSEETICSETGIKSPKTVRKHNEILEEMKLVKITKHVIGTDYSYSSDDGKLNRSRYNNHYAVRLENLL